MSEHLTTSQIRRLVTADNRLQKLPDVDDAFFKRLRARFSQLRTILKEDGFLPPEMVPRMRVPSCSSRLSIEDKINRTVTAVLDGSSRTSVRDDIFRLFSPDTIAEIEARVADRKARAESYELANPQSSQASVNKGLSKFHDARHVSRAMSKRNRIISEFYAQELAGRWCVFGTGTYDDLKIDEVDDHAIADRLFAEFDRWLACARRDFGLRRRSDLPYAAVLESGEKKGRLHLHWLAWLPWHECLAASPGNWDGQPWDHTPGEAPFISRLSGFNSDYWRIGRCRVQPCRHHPSDRWGQIGWQFPNTRVRMAIGPDGKPRQLPIEQARCVGGAQAAAYLSGYIKDGGVPGYKRGFRASLGLGMKELRDLLGRAPRRFLRPLAHQAFNPAGELRAEHFRLSPKDIQTAAANERFRRCEARYPLWCRRLMAGHRSPSVLRATMDALDAVAAFDAAVDVEIGDLAVSMIDRVLARNDEFAVAMAQSIAIGGSPRRQLAAVDWLIQSLPAFQIPQSAHFDVPSSPVVVRSDPASVKDQMPAFADPPPSLDGSQFKTPVSLLFDACSGIRTTASIFHALLSSEAQGPSPFSE